MLILFADRMAEQIPQRGERKGDALAAKAGTHGRSRVAASRN